MKKTAYDIDYHNLPDSEPITDPAELLRLKLIGYFHHITRNLETKEILKITKLDRADLSRLRVLDYKRFSLDRLVTLLDRVGYQVQVKTKKKS